MIMPPAPQSYQLQAPTMMTTPQKPPSEASTLLISSTGKKVPSVDGKEFTTQVKRLLESKHYTGGDMMARRNLLGSLIFNYTTHIVGEKAAPKVTGMLLGLDSSDFEITLSNFDLFRAKAQEALSLLTKQ